MSLTPPPDIDLHADKGSRVMSSGVALIVLPTLFVTVRFVWRVIARAGFWWDDLLVIVSLMLSYGPSTAMMICMCPIAADNEIVPTRLSCCQKRLTLNAAARYNGFGKYLWALPDPKHNTSQFLKILYFYIIYYYAAVVSIQPRLSTSLCKANRDSKSSLTFYQRIFPVTEIRI